jgi:glycosyltransferase involved in cell wall biosynthesis
MTPISATIITLDEAANIARAIGSLAAMGSGEALADEVLVVDSGSTDGTQDIARQLGARVIEHPWPGFAAQKNFASAAARHDWILSLDADEELNDDARAAIQLWKASPPRAAGYRFARRARYLGRWILHSGWYPDYKVRLFDRRRGAWQGSYIHESAAVQGDVLTLPGEILHYTCDSIEDHKKRLEVYTDLAAREMAATGERPGFARRALVPPWIFCETYFLKLGVLDGPQGLWIARMAARYVRRKYAKAVEASKERPE